MPFKQAIMMQKHLQMLRDLNQNLNTSKIKLSRAYLILFRAMKDQTVVHRQDPAKVLKIGGQLLKLYHHLQGLLKHNLRLAKVKEAAVNNMGNLLNNHQLRMMDLQDRIVDFQHRFRAHLLLKDLLKIAMSNLNKTESLKSLFQKKKLQQIQSIRWKSINISLSNQQRYLRLLRLSILSVKK